MGIYSKQIQRSYEWNQLMMTVAAQANVIPWIMPSVSRGRVRNRLVSEPVLARMLLATTVLETRVYIWSLSLSSYLTTSVRLALRSQSVPAL